MAEIKKADYLFLAWRFERKRKSLCDNYIDKCENKSFNQSQKKLYEIKFREILEDPNILK